VQIAKRNELHKLDVIPKRWKNCERKLNTSLQFVYLAFLTLLLKIL